MEYRRYASPFEQADNDLVSESSQTDKDTIINSVVANLADIFSPVQLRMIESEMIRALSNVEFAKTTTQLSINIDETDRYLKLFVANYKLMGRTTDTIKNYMYVIKAFLRKADKPVGDISRDYVKFYLLTESSTNQWSPSYVITVKRYIGQLFTFLHDEGFIRKNPTKGIVLADPPKKDIVYLTDDEIVRMQDAAHSLEEKAILNFCLSTGCRVGEITAIKKSDVDLLEGSVNVISEKSKKPRTVFLTPRAKQYLKDYLGSRSDNCDSLFISGKRKTDKQGNLVTQPISQDRLEFLSKRLAKRAGISKNCTIHIYRKTLASTLINNNCPVQVIQKILGHSSPDVTLSYYANISTKSIKESFDHYMQY